MKKILVVGAGLSGATLARHMAENGVSVDIIESREHIGGNCYDEIDPKTNVFVHKYGPHIFHTDKSEVWDFVNKFDDFIPYRLQVKTKVKNEIYSLPVNLHTINQYYRTSLSPKQAKQHIEDLSKEYSELDNKSFRDIGLKSVGKEMYDAFFKSYAEKQWGVSDNLIPSGVLKRLPIRLNYDDNYFNHKYQGIPKNGYTHFLENLLRHPLIKIQLNTKVSISDLRLKLSSNDYCHVVFTGPVDELYDYECGRLPYRTLKFEKKYLEDDDLGCAVMAHPSDEYEFTRITDHKYFMPWRLSETTGSIQYLEYSSEASIEDEKYYPVRLTEGNEIWTRYEALLAREPNVSFVGRLAEFKYMDMDVCIESATKKSQQLIKKLT